MAKIIYLLFFALGPVYWLPNVPPEALLILKTALLIIVFSRIIAVWAGSGRFEVLRTPVWLFMNMIMAVIFSAFFHAEPVSDLLYVGNLLLPLFLVAALPLIRGKELVHIEEGIRKAPYLFAMVCIFVPAGLFVESMNWVNPFSEQIEGFTGSQTYTGFGGSRTGWGVGATLIAAVALVNCTLAAGFKRKILSYGALLVILTAVFIPGGRVGIASFGSMLCVLILIYASRKSTFKRSFAWLLFFGILSSIALMFASELRLDTILAASDISEASTGRTEGWSVGMDLLAGNPLFGIGVEETQRAGAAYGFILIHNTILNFAVKFGAIAAFLNFLIFVWIFVRLFQGWSRAAYSPMTLIAILLMVSVSVTVMVEPETVFGSFFNILLFWFVIAIFLSKERARRQAHALLRNTSRMAAT